MGKYGGPAPELSPTTYTTHEDVTDRMDLRGPMMREAAQPAASGVKGSTEAAGGTQTVDKQRQYTMNLDRLPLPRKCQLTSPHACVSLAEPNRRRCPSGSFKAAALASIVVHD
jgi:hypothetical protein